MIVPDPAGRGAFRYSYSEDLADVFVRVLNNPEAFGLAFNVVQDEVFTMDSYLGAIAAAAGTQADVVYVPEAVLATTPLASYRLPSPAQVLLDSYAARRYLHFVPQPATVWLKQTADWFLHEHRGPDPSGYDKRSVEIDVARRWQAVRL